MSKPDTRRLFPSQVCITEQYGGLTTEKIGRIAATVRQATSEVAGHRTKQASSRGRIESVDCRQVAHFPDSGELVLQYDLFRQWAAVN